MWWKADPVRLSLGLLFAVCTYSLSNTCMHIGLLTCMVQCGLAWRLFFLCLWPDLFKTKCQRLRLCLVTDPYLSHSCDSGSTSLSSSSSGSLRLISPSATHTYSTHTHTHVHTYNREHVLCYYFKVVYVYVFIAHICVTSAGVIIASAQILAFLVEKQGRLRLRLN